MTYLRVRDTLDDYLELEDEFDWLDDFDNELDLFNSPANWLDNQDYAVIGPTDDRFRVRAQKKKPSTLMFPFNTICLLERFIKVGSTFRINSLVTGTLIAPQVVLTAKHCLMRLAKNQRKAVACKKTPQALQAPFFPMIEVIPGADFEAADPQLKRPADPQRMFVNSSQFRADPHLDYGVIILPKPFRRPNRFMMLQPRRDGGTKTLLTIAGYPCDKPAGTMWGHSERVKEVTKDHLRYPIDTCPGHSGSPIWLLGNNEIRLLLGIHTAAPSGCDNDPAAGVQCRRTGAPVTPVAGLNCGVRITCHVINTILGWCREFGVQEPVIDKPTYKKTLSIEFKCDLTHQ